mmetsp:Transcript_12834/g.31134  ORF Transcript_12834/g.31134 Transcript_12834/m.31134 type:complete len:302 (-) Transcript_12834:829-1734(-)
MNKVKSWDWWQSSTQPLPTPVAMLDRRYFAKINFRRRCRKNYLELFGACHFVIRVSTFARRTGSSLFRQDKLQEEVSEKLSRIIRCLPFRYTGFHLCASDWIVKACAPFIKMIIGKKYRVRLRVHVGSNTECEYALLSFGIPVSTLPLSYDCKVKATAHNKWIARQSVREQHIRLSNVIFAGIDLPTNNDCLLGRGRDRYRHRGNHLLRYHVESFLSKYESAAYGDKLSITSVIVRIVKENGGRFLQAEKDGWWVEVDDSAAQDKVSHAFRTLRIAETTGATAGANADKKTERSNKKARKS